METVVIAAAARAELRDRPEARAEEVVVRHVARHHPLLDDRRRAVLCEDVLAELTGLGPLQRWLATPGVTEVIVNAGTEIWVDRNGRPERVGSLAAGQIEGLIERIIAPLGLRLDRTSPIVDARLPDGARLCAVIPPISPDGTCCSIRRFRPQPFELFDFAEPAIGELLVELVAVRANLVISGPTSSGKTSLLNALASTVDRGERLVTIEDTAELHLAHPHVVRLEARRDRHEAVTPITIGDLVRTALRLRPDRLVVGEVRGGEAFDMVQALNTGHDGSMTTCHANSPLDALRRIESMVLVGSPSWPMAAVREQVHSAIDAVVQLGRTGDGRRRVVAIGEVVPPEALGTAGTGRVRPLVGQDRTIAAVERGRR